MSNLHDSGHAPVRQPDLSQAAPLQASTAVRRPSICFVAPLAWPVLSGDTSIAVVGGAEVQQSILARLLAQLGYPVSMICLDYGQANGTAVDGVKVYRAFRPQAGIPGLRFFHPRLTSLWRAMADADADIYYQRSADMLTAVVAGFCRRHGRHSIFAGASDGDFIPGQQMIAWRRDRWLFERGLAHVDAVVVQNRAQQESCLHHYGRPATLIPSCYELPADARPGAGDIVLWVGNLRSSKRPELFVEMARRLPARRFVLIGDATMDPLSAESLASIRRAAAELGNLELTGYLPLAQAERYFDRAKVVVNTSIVEGMPNTFLQAWARGVPTIAFIDVGAKQDGTSVYRIVSGIDEAVTEIERLFADEIHFQHASRRCGDYFARTHASAAVIQRFSRLLDGLGGKAEEGTP